MAVAYAPYAARNRFKPKEPQGLRGRVVGYADPRRSVAPDNGELSAKRAEWTAHFLPDGTGRREEFVLPYDEYYGMWATELAWQPTAP